MGALKGSISYTLYHVEGEPGPGFETEALERIHEFRIQDLHPVSDADSHHGWCVLDDMLDVEFTRDKIFRGEYLCLGMRVDRWSLPGALLKARLRRAEDEVKLKTGRQRLFKSERETLRNQMVLELKQQLVPTANAFDMVWNIQKRQLRFWTQSGGRLELFLELFESTFGLRLYPTHPYIAALHVGLTNDEVVALDDLSLTRFTDFG